MSGMDKQLNLAYLAMLAMHTSAKRLPWQWQSVNDDVNTREMLIARASGVTITFIKFVSGNYRILVDYNETDGCGGVDSYHPAMGDQDFPALWEEVKAIYEQQRDQALKEVLGISFEGRVGFQSPETK